MKNILKIFVGLLKKIYYKTITIYYNLKHNVRIGKNVIIGKNIHFSKKNYFEIKDNVYVGKNCHFGSNLIVGNNSLIASNVSFVGGDHKIDNIGETLIIKSGRDILLTTIIEDNCWIGHGSIIIHGVKIKSGAVIGAGSVLTKNVGENEIWAGNPAKLIRKRILK